MNEEMQQLKAELAMAGPSHTAMQADPRISAVELATSQESAIHGKDGAETRVARFCEKAFISPEAARSGSTALLQAFDDSGLWLANLVQPQHLVAELRQSCSTLTLVIITQWTRQGETHKLARLATALLDASPAISTHEAGQVCALLASLLGILRPPRAQGLLELGRPLLKDSVDPHLLREAREWVDLGRILEAAPPEDRFLWNRRLREPDDEWDWDTPEARSALRRLAPLIASRTNEDLSRFQRTVPPCWWDLLRDPPETYRTQHPTSHQTPPSDSGRPPYLTYSDANRDSHHGYGDSAHPSHFSPQDWNRPAPLKIPTFAMGILTGLTCMAMISWYASTRGSSTPSAAPAVAAVAAPPLASPGPQPVIPSAPIPLSPAPEPQWPQTVQPAPPPQSAPSPVQVASLPAPVMKEPAPISNHPQALRRQASFAELRQENPRIQRIHSIVKNGSLRESESLLNGQASINGFTQRDYEALIRGLMLDPPEQEPVRRAVAKIAARVLPSRDLLSTLALCIYPGSPNAAEAIQSANWALELDNANLAPSDRQALQALNTPLAQNGN